MTPRILPAPLHRKTKTNATNAKVKTMTNIITFSISTEAPYSEDEKDDLLAAWVDFMTEQDGDVDSNSADIDVVNTDEAAKQVAARKQEIITEFLEGATFTAQVNISRDGENLASLELSE